MKPTDPTDLLNWEAMNIRTADDDKIIKERLDKARLWLRKTELKN